MSLEEFFNTYFTGQKELSVMAAMGPSERAQFLSRVLWLREAARRAVARPRSEGHCRGLWGYGRLCQTPRRSRRCSGDAGRG